MTRLRLLLSAVVIGALGIAATAGTGQLKVTADTFVVDDQQHVATFTGNVVMTRGEMTMWAPKVVVEYTQSGGTHQAAGGTDASSSPPPPPAAPLGGNSSVRSVVATGGVRIKTSQQEATGDRADYDPRTQILKLTGHVKVTNANGQLEGPALVIDLTTNVSTFSGSSSGRVTGVFTPPAQ
jgi:lipopolysaccharide export system protein LptA